MTPKLYLLNIITLEFSISTYEIGGYTNIQVKTRLIFFFFFFTGSGTYKQKVLQTTVLDHSAPPAKCS